MAITHVAIMTARQFCIGQTVKDEITEVIETKLIQDYDVAPYVSLSDTPKRVPQIIQLGFRTFSA